MKVVHTAWLALLGGIIGVGIERLSWNEPEEKQAAPNGTHLSAAEIHPYGPASTLPPPSVSFQPMIERAILAHSNDDHAEMARQFLHWLRSADQQIIKALLESDSIQRNFDDLLVCRP